MKAFQLKVMIKNSKPPIWRRLVVPAGITFSQLSMILNEAMGWGECYLFEFEFYHLQRRIFENAEEFAGMDYYDYQNASQTFIREYLEENDWFSYIHDSREDWAHRVTVEKILEDWEYDYPQIIKYKGSCPNDAGQYDMEAVNEVLREQFFYIWGKREKRCQRELYQEHKTGSYGLRATRKDKNKKGELVLSRAHQNEAIMREMADLMKEYMKYQQQLEKEAFAIQSLKDILIDYEKADLLEIAKEKGVKGISGSGKVKLIDKLYSFMMEESEIKKYFYCMDAETRKKFEEAMNNTAFCTGEYIDYLIRLYHASYIGMLEDGRIKVTGDVKDAYLSLKNAEFEAECDKRSYVFYCVKTAERLYGITPMEILMELVNKDRKQPLTELEVRKILEEIPVEYKDFVLKEGKLYNIDLYPDDRGLLAEQGEKKYYIPSKAEIMDMGIYGYMSKEACIRSFKKYLTETLDALADEAECAAGVIWNLIGRGCEMQDIFEVLEDLGLMVDEDWELQMLNQKIQYLWKHTRMLIHRGHTSAELNKNRPPLCVLSEPENNIVSFEAAKMKKVYPNDPCPCGSGKKYKNCCKNKK